MAKCGWIKPNGRPCKNPVKREGIRCWQHKHMRVAGPKPNDRRAAAVRTQPRSRRRETSAKRSGGTPTRGATRPRKSTSRKAKLSRDRSYKSLSAAKRKRVDSTIALCADVVTSGWQETVIDRAGDYASSETFHKLIRARRRSHCKALAQVAELILAAKDKAHELVGKLGGGILSLFGVDSLAKRFGRELIERIPLPWDAKAVAAARGVQVTGILLCLLNGDDLRRCQCFIDLALEQAKTAVKKILTAAVKDWTQLALFPAKPEGGPIRSGRPQGS